MPGTERGRCWQNYTRRNNSRNWGSQPQSAGTRHPALMRLAEGGSELKVKLYLQDENGNSPNFGVDQELEWDEETVFDYRHWLVTEEGFEFTDNPDWLLRKDDGKLYRVCWHY